MHRDSARQVNTRESQHATAIEIQHATRQTASKCPQTITISCKAAVAPGSKHLVGDSQGIHRHSASPLETSTETAYTLLPNTHTDEKTASVEEAAAVGSHW